MPFLKNRLSKRLSKVALCLAASLSVCTQTALAARFTDLNSSYAEKQINDLADKGILQAEADGKFHPGDPVTRAQLAVWLVKTAGLEGQSVPTVASFADVKTTDWFFKAVEICRQNNYIAGYPDGFRPKQFIQRGEMISIIARALGTANPDSGAVSRALSGFSDKGKIPDWAKNGIAQAQIAGILTTKDGGKTIDATGIATRADTVAILDGLSGYMTKQSISQALNKPLTGQETPQFDAPAPPAQFAQQPYQQPAQQPYQQPYQQPAQQPFQNPYQPQQFSTAPQMGQTQPGQPESFMAQPQYQQQPYSGMAQGQAPLSGRVVVIGAGTQFQGSLRNTLDSGATQPGEPVEATLSNPIYSGGVEVIPAGSKVIGQVTNVISAKRFRFGANGRIDMKFTSVETPDGRRFPLNASVNDAQIKLVGGSTAGRVGKGLLTTAVGAGSGAALGTALGAIVGATSHGRVGLATGMGATFGTAIGGGVGLVGAGVRKGSEVILHAGTPLPIQLDDSMQVTVGQASPAYGQPYGGYQQPNQGYPQQGYPQQNYQQPNQGNPYGTGSGNFQQPY